MKLVTLLVGALLYCGTARALPPPQAVADSCMSAVDSITNATIARLEVHSTLCTQQVETLLAHGHESGAQSVADRCAAGYSELLYSRWAVLRHVRDRCLSLLTYLGAPADLLVTVTEHEDAARYMIAAEAEAATRRVLFPFADEGE